jgi:GNAT superfamily N-acetyltransferase
MPPSLPAHTTVRPARKEDLTAVMGLIHELAEYERAPEEVVNHAEQLREDFLLHQAFELLVATVHHEVVGMSLFFPVYSTWKGRSTYLEDLYVQPQHRGKGLGYELLRQTAERARQLGSARLHWQVLDWNTPSLAFYEKLGAVVERDWYNCKLYLHPHPSPTP